MHVVLALSSAVLSFSSALTAITSKPLHRVWHFGASQTGAHTSSHTFVLHDHLHSGVQLVLTGLAAGGGGGPWSTFGQGEEQDEADEDVEELDFVSVSQLLHSLDCLLGAI